jgi:predicted MFS family arabinose efflux permease
MKPPPERVLLLLLAAVQFTHIMDFMILMPLGPQLMRTWDLSPLAFTRLISVYSIVAGLAGLAAAPFMDRFDRRRSLLLFYAGFALSTAACGLATSASMLFLARALCGLFGGVAGAVVLAIVGDLIPPTRRGSAMGMIGAAYSVAAALGIPFGLFLANRFGWPSPFLFLATLAALNAVLLWHLLPPIRSHLDQPHHPGLSAFFKLLRDANAGRGLLFMSLLVFGHFAIIPLLAPHLVGNLGLPESQLALVYLFGGLASAITAPWIGRLSDRHGRLPVFTVLAITASLITLAIALPRDLPTWIILPVASSYFVFASGRFIPAQTALSLAVQPIHRGAYMNLNHCARDFAAAFSSTLAGWLVVRTPDQRLLHFDRLGWLAVCAAFLTVLLLRHIRAVERSPIQPS